MNRRFWISLVMAATFAVLSPAIVLAKGWEPLKVEKSEAKHVASDSEIQIRAGGGSLFITTSRHLNIKIFTILGSQIANDTLAPGSYQFTVPAHGVYIIKAGDLTCKVAL